MRAVRDPSRSGRLFPDLLAPLRTALIRGFLNSFAMKARAGPYGSYNKYILLTKREGRTGRISARGLDSTDRAQRGPYKKDRGPIFS